MTSAWRQRLRRLTLFRVVRDNMRFSWVIAVLAVMLGCGSDEPRELTLVEYGEWCATMYDIESEGTTWEHATDATEEFLKEFRSVAAPPELKEYHRGRTAQMTTFYDVFARQPSQEPVDLFVLLVEPTVVLVAAQYHATLDGLPAHIQDFLAEAKCSN